MRAPSLAILMRYAQSIGLLIAGAVIGCAVFMVVYQHNFNELILYNVSLQTEIEDLQTQLNALSEDRNQHSTIHAIQIEIEKAEPKLETFIENEIKNRVKRSLGSLVGQSSDTLNPAMARELFGEKLYPDIRDKDYIVNIRTMLVSQGTLHIWVSVRMYQKVN